MEAALPGLEGDPGAPQKPRGVGQKSTYSPPGGKGYRVMGLWLFVGPEGSPGKKAMEALISLLFPTTNLWVICLRVPGRTHRSPREEFPSGTGLPDGHECSSDTVRPDPVHGVLGFGGAY